LSGRTSDVAFPIARVAADLVGHATADITCVVRIPVAAARHASLEVGVCVRWKWFPKIRPADVDATFDLVVIAAGLYDGEVVCRTQGGCWHWR
jgi:hypothetical protein